MMIIMMNKMKVKMKVKIMKILWNNQKKKRINFLNNNNKNRVKNMI